MADETKPTETPVVNQPAEGTATPPPADTTAPTSEEKSEDKAIPYDRFKAVNEEKKALAAELEAMKKSQEEAEKKQLEEQQRYKELYEKEKEQNAAKEASLREAQQKTQFMGAIEGLGLADKDVAYMLIQDKLAQLETDEQGNLVGVNEVVNTLLEEKPYLVNKAQGAIGSPTNPATTQSAPTGTRIYTNAEISDAKFYEEHKSDINKALVEGRIRD